MFALEDCLAERAGDAGGVAMLWQTSPSVMLGCNQVAGAEVNLAEAEARGVKVVRRSSGGGTIYTDPGTLQVSFLLPYDGKEPVSQAVRAGFAQPVAAALSRLGIDAVPDGRNDITESGRKISGFAQTLHHGRLCCHCSILYDADLDAMDALLRPDGDKISGGAPRSVRSRVKNLRGLFPPLSMPDFINRFKEALLGGCEIYRLTDADIAAARCIRKYADSRWTYGNTPAYTYHNAGKFSGGRISIYMSVEKGNISQCSIRGDFLSSRPVAELEERLKGVLCSRGALKEALYGMDLCPYLGEITPDELVSLL